MKVYVIYDETGSVYAVRYGEDQTAPEEIRGIVQEIPEGSLITRVDVSNPVEPKILFTPSRESALEKELKEVKAQLAYISMMSGIEMEAGDE